MFSSNVPIVFTAEAVRAKHDQPVAPCCGARGRRLRSASVTQSVPRAEDFRLHLATLRKWA